jgi:hypothetical protein
MISYFFWWSDGMECKYDSYYHDRLALIAVRGFFTGAHTVSTENTVSWGLIQRHTKGTSGNVEFRIVCT